MCLVACLMALLATSCSKSAEDLLREDIRESNKDLPEDLGDSMICERIAYTHGDVYYYFTFDEDEFPFYDEEYFEIYSEEVKFGLLSDDDSDVRDVLKLCRDVNADIICQYTSVQGNTYTIRVPIN